jgi:hypothetical protein
MHARSSSSGAVVGGGPPRSAAPRHELVVAAATGRVRIVGGRASSPLVGRCHRTVEHRDGSLEPLLPGATGPLDSVLMVVALRGCAASPLHLRDRSCCRGPGSAVSGRTVRISRRVSVSSDNVGGVTNRGDALTRALGSSDVGRRLGARRGRLHASRIRPSSILPVVAGSAAEPFAGAASALRDPYHSYWTAARDSVIGRVQRFMKSTWAGCCWYAR